jgi:uncharacterized repeat protein (TIGR01451 family)
MSDMIYRTWFLVIALIIPSFALADDVKRVRPLRVITPAEQPRPGVKIGMLHALPDLRLRGFSDPTQTIQPALLFESNVGQAAQGFGFVLRSVEFAAGFSDTGFTAVVIKRPPGDDTDPEKLAGQAIQLEFRGAKRVNPAGHDPVKTSFNIVGKDPSKRSSKAPAFTAVGYEGLYPGVGMLAAGANGRLSYGFLLEPNAEIGKIRIRVHGISELERDPRGNLLLKTQTGTIAQVRPRFTEVGGPEGRKELKGNFVVFAKDEYGFEVSGRSPGRQLTIDPEIVFATYFGGGNNEGTLEADTGATDLHGQGFDVAIGPQSNAYVVGTTVSPDFPVTAAGIVPASTDAFVLRLDPALPPGNQIRYATVIGGSGFERGVAVAPLDDGSVYITGCTTSSDFPTSTGVLQPTRGSSVGYIVRLTPDGEFDIGTLLGNAIIHHPASIAFSKRASEPEGFVYVAGSIQGVSAGTPSEAGSPGFQTAYGGGTDDGFVAKINAALTHFEYFTFLGGSGRDLIRDLAVNDGFAFVTGTTTSINFPTTEFAQQGTHSQATTGIDCTSGTNARQCFDAFVTRIGRDGSALVYSTFFGGNDEEYGRGIAVSSTNQATITGAAKPTSGNDTQIFVVRYEGGGENTLWIAQPLPGSGRDHGEEIVVDAIGRAHVVGTISRDGLSTTDASFHGGASDIFYARFSAATGEKEFFTYIGGTGEDRGFAVAAQGATADQFCAFVVGSTTSQDIATVAPLAGGEQNKGRADLLMVRLCDFPPKIVSGGIHKTVFPSAVNVGETFTYTVSVQNDGDAPAGITITDTPPSELAVTNVSGSGCGRSGNTVTCSLNADPGTTSIDITAKTDPNLHCPTNVLNTATIRVGNQSLPPTSASVQIQCIPPKCGNGVIDTDTREQCDPEDPISRANCRSDCTLRRCGDNRLDPGEQCDGTAPPGQSCDRQCRLHKIKGEDCQSGGLPCEVGNVCGRRCGMAACVGGHVIFGVCFFGTDELLCQLNQCMDPSQATFTVP